MLFLIKAAGSINRAEIIKAYTASNSKGKACPKHLEKLIDELKIKGKAVSWWPADL